MRYVKFYLFGLISSYLQACSFKMAALWPRSVLSFSMDRDEKQPKGNLTNIQRS